MSYLGFYINLDRSPERRAEMEAEFARVGLAGRYARFPAADGNVLGVTNSTLNATQIGCFTSHYLLLKANAAAGRHLHVLEDDAILCAHTATAVDEVLGTTAFADYDVLCTEGFVTLNTSELQRYKNTYDQSIERNAAGEVLTVRLKFMPFVACTSSCLINAKAIGKIAALCESEIAAGLTLPIDLFLRKKAREGAIRVGCLFPFVTSIRIDRLFDASTLRSYDERSSLAAALVRQSFFIGCDIEALAATALRDLPAPPDDPHWRLLRHVTDFALTPEFRIF